MGSVITDDTVEPLAYAVCNTDGVEGLTWAEVELCEVSNCKKIEILTVCRVPWIETLYFFLSKTPKEF